MQGAEIPTAEQAYLQRQEEKMGDTEKLASCSIHDPGREGCEA